MILSEHQSLIQLFGALSTFGATIVALTMPFLLRGLQASKARRMIAREVRENLRLLKNFRDAHYALCAEDVSDPKHLRLDLEYLKSRLSDEAWLRLRFEVTPDQEQCLSEAYDAIERILKPHPAEKMWGLPGEFDQFYAFAASETIEDLIRTCRYFSV